MLLEALADSVNQQYYSSCLVSHCHLPQGAPPDHDAQSNRLRHMLGDLTFLEAFQHTGAVWLWWGVVVLGWVLRSGVKRGVAGVGKKRNWFMLLQSGTSALPLLVSSSCPPASFPSTPHMQAACSTSL